MNHLSCFLCKTTKSISHYKKTNLQMFDNPFPGIEMGFPLTIFENIFTKNHYGFNILTVQSILLQFAICFSPAAYTFNKITSSASLKQEQNSLK